MLIAPGGSGPATRLDTELRLNQLVGRPPRRTEILYRETERWTFRPIADAIGKEFPTLAGDPKLFDPDDLLSDPNADHTGVIQDTIDAIADGGGGVIRLPWQRINITQLRMKTRIVLEGGSWATELFQIANSTDGGGGPLHMIILDNVNVEHAVVRNLRMHGNKSNQVSANDGIFYDNLGGSWTTNDQLHVVQNVFIDSCKGNGVSRGPAVREMRIIDTHATRCDGRGIHVPGAGGTDNWIINCTASACGLSGFRPGYFDRHIGCKAFGNGLLGVADDRSGFVVDGIGEMFSGCDAQENSGPGWLLHGARGCTFADCSATSNQQEGWLIKASANNLLFVSSGSVSGHAWIQTMDFKFEAGSVDNEIHINTQGFDLPPSNVWDEIGKETNHVVLNRHIRGVRYNLEGAIGQDKEHFSWGKVGAGSAGNPYYSLKTDNGAVPGGLIGSWDGAAFRTYMIFDHPNSRLLLGDPASVPDVLVIAPRFVMLDGVIASHDGTEGSTEDEHFVWGKAGSTLHYSLKSDSSPSQVAAVSSWDGTSGHTFIRFNHALGRVTIGAAGDTEAVWGGTLIPENPSTQDLGSSVAKWRDLWLSQNADIDGTLDVAGFSVLAGIIVNGGTEGAGRIWKAAASGLVIQGIVGTTWDLTFNNPAGDQNYFRVATGTNDLRFGGALIPQVNLSRALGESATRWNNLYTGAVDATGIITMGVSSQFRKSNPYGFHDLGGGAQRIHIGSLLVSNSFGDGPPPTNGIWVKGAIKSFALSEFAGGLNVTGGGFLSSVNLHVTNRIQSIYGTDGVSSDEHYRFGKAGSGVAGNPYFVFKTDATALAIASLESWDGTTALVYLRGDPNLTRVLLGSNGVVATVVDGTFELPNIPTSAPGGTGQVWNDAGTLKIT